MLRGNGIRPLLDGIYTEAIDPAIRACGLDLVRVDKIQHNGIVNDVMLGGSPCGGTRR